MVKREALRQGLLIAAVSLVAVALALAHGKTNWPVPDAAKKLKNPVAASPAALAASKAIYVEKCAECHGDRGKGDGPMAVMYATKPADLTDAHMMAEMSDGEIFYKISEGRQPMPTFKKQLSDAQRWQLVHFLRTFAKKPAGAAAQKSAAKKAALSKP